MDWVDRFWIGLYVGGGLVVVLRRRIVLIWRVICIWKCLLLYSEYFLKEKRMDIVKIVVIFVFW